MQTAAIVLAGGRSTRLGRDKASEPLLGVTLLQRVVETIAPLVDEVIVVRRPGQPLPQLSTSVVVLDDLYPDAGPLGGLYTGLTSIRAPLALAVACDMPLLQPSLLRELLRLGGTHAAVVPRFEGRQQPLCAVYARRCIDAIRRRLDAGALRLTDVFDDLDAVVLEPDAWRPFDPDGASFLNVNRDEDLREAERRLEAAQRARMS